jgi:hypothetical protein
VSCGGTLYYAFVGFSRAELDSAVSYYYFNGQTFSIVELASYYTYPSSNDSSSDTLLLAASQLNDGISGSLGFAIPSDNLMYKITNIIFGGDVYENQPCREGSPTPGFCTGGLPYLGSYEINGILVTVPKSNIVSDTTGYIYIHK